MNNKAGLYIHIPFCKSKCPYCDFYSNKYCEKDARDYCSALVNQMQSFEGEFDTVYFGGGTPSIIPEELIGNIITQSKRRFGISEDSEITIECNPSKDLKESFRLYKSYGINRISLGMQSAVDKERFALGRSAGKTQVEKAVFDAKNAGIENISLDLMLGTPGQTLASLDETFDFIDKMKVQHISAYMLKIEEGTKFFEMQDRLELPTEETVSEMYLKTIEVLSQLGFPQYEISNFAIKGFESRHNLKYWELKEYLGLGVFAHSFWKGKRFYVDESFNIVFDGEGGTKEEEIMLGLRLNKGINKKLITKNYQPFIEMGYLEEKGENIALTPKGMLVSNTVICALLPDTTE
ncbi:MAG: radical SAM family heme chaperone HemW [Eubacterium sp.]|nr:radical SAM family heme chaperone HemW [Eubacterium sp.]